MSDAESHSTSFSSHAMSGGRWGAVRSFGLQFLSLLTTAVLARILSDDDFGLVAITVVVITMFELLTRVGIGASIVQQRDLTDEVKSTFFWASLALGVTAGGLAAGGSRAAAELAGSAEAAPLIAVAALTIPLGLASNVPLGLLSRGLRFRALTIVQLASNLSHSAVAITLAFLGFGAWAIVIGQVVRGFGVLVGTVVISGFRPIFAFDTGILRAQLSFNFGVLGADLVAYGNKNADYWFVGNQLGTGPLGIYYVAYVLPNVLRRRITAIGDQVLYPIVSRIQDDKERIVSAYLRVVKLITFVVVPAMLGITVVADLAVRIGFGSEWLDAVDPLRIISAAAAVTAMVVPARPVFPALRMPSVLVKAGLASLAALGLGLFVGMADTTLVRVALAVLMATFVEAIVLQWNLRSVLGLRIATYLRALGPFVVSAGIMVLAVSVLRSQVIGQLPSVPQAILAVGSGAVVYFAIGLTVFRSDFTEQLRGLRELIGRKS